MPRYRNPEYANDKIKINPRNRGFWDLRLTGEYYRNIKVDVYGSIVFFKQPLNNTKVQWLHRRLIEGGRNRALGITTKQIEDVQLKNKPELFKKLDKIISG